MEARSEALDSKTLDVIHTNTSQTHSSQLQVTTYIKHVSDLQLSMKTQNSCVLSLVTLSVLKVVRDWTK